MGGYKLVVLSAVVVAAAVVAARASMEAEEKECTDQLTQLASCIPFVSGTAAKPTAECCEDAERVRSKKPECLCVLIKESTDPSLGLPVKTSLALQMPAACHSDARVSECPRILKLPPDSPDAKIFKDSKGILKLPPDSKDLQAATPTTSATPSTSSPASSSSASGSSDSKAAPASEGGRLEAGFGVKSAVGFILSAAAVFM